MKVLILSVLVTVILMAVSYALGNRPDPVVSGMVGYLYANVLAGG